MLTLKRKSQRKLAFDRWKANQLEMSTRLQPRHATASVTWTLENLKGSKGNRKTHTCWPNPKSDLIWTLIAKLERGEVVLLIKLEGEERFDLDFECQVGERWC
jgi:predicted glycosyl hydrolase (DUF1957 family)